MIEYRKIRPSDNLIVKNIIRTAMTEYGGNRPGTAYYDKEINDMFASYDKQGAAYFVAVNNKAVVGGGGIQPLKGSNENICELQKVYLNKDYRGQGIGRKIVELCIEFAEKMGYDAIYLETFPNMKGAQILYKKKGFVFLENSKGNTGHCTNEIWMLKKLKN